MQDYIQKSGKKRLGKIEGGDVLKDFIHDICQQGVRPKCDYRQTTANILKAADANKDTRERIAARITYHPPKDWFSRYKVLTKTNKNV